MVRIAIIVFMIALLFVSLEGGAVLQEMKAKVADSAGGYIFSERINGKRSVCVKINDTLRIRDSAKVYARITDSIRGYAKITDTVRTRGYIDIADSVKKIRRMDTLVHISDSVNIRGNIAYIDTINKIVRIKNVDTPIVTVNLIQNLQSPVDLFGSATNVTQNIDTIDLWTQGWTYRFPTAGQQMACSSSSASDAPAGSGIDSVYIDYLDTNYTQKNTTCGLNGTTVVNTAVSDIFRVNSVHAKHFGSSSTTYKAIGNIYVRKKADLRSIYKIIPAGYTHSRGFNYTVPSGKTLYITSLSLSAGNSLPSNNCAAFFTLKATFDRDRNTTTTAGLFFLPHYEVYLTNQTFQRNFEIPLNFPERTDIKMSVYVNQTSSVLSGFANGMIK